MLLEQLAELMDSNVEAGQVWEEAVSEIVMFHQSDPH